MSTGTDTADMAPVASDKAQGSEEEGASPESGAPEKPSGGSLKKLALKGSAYELMGYGASMVLRLGGNLVLTRFLLPSDFGLVAIVNAILYGLEMMSDVGLRMAVIQQENGDDQEFLDTVWTLQVARGFFLWIIACLVTYPIAEFYEEPELLLLIPVGASATLVSGFCSTSLYTVRRHLRLGLVNLVEFVGRLVATIVMISWAMVSPTVWALAAGGVANGLVRLVSSYMIPVGYRNKFHWDKESAGSVVHFGKWIFGSTALFYVGSRMDQFMLGHYMDMATLGVYSFAVMIGEAAYAVMAKIIRGVLFPVFSRFADMGHDRLRSAYYETRLRLDALAMPAVGGLMALSQFIIDLGWDERYAAAGWMLELLCLRVAMGIVLDCCEICFIAAGHPRWAFFRNLVRTAWVLIGIPVAYQHFGLEGLVWVFGLSELPLFFVMFPAFYRMGFLRLSREILALLFFLAGYGLGRVLLPPLEMLAAAWL
ncbi:MAG: oligosaccharide flippase family protein [Myxococcota bacterium]